MNDLPTVVVLAGLPGAGKTTLSTTLRAGDPRWSFLSRDEIRAAMFQPCEFTMTEKSASFEVVLRTLEVLVELGRDCVVDGMPFSRVGELESVEERVGRAGGRVVSFHLDLPIEVAVERVGRTSTDDGGPQTQLDRVPALVHEVAARMRDFPERVIRLDSTRSPAELAAEVTTYVEGDLS